MNGALVGDTAHADEVPIRGAELLIAFDKPRRLADELVDPPREAADLDVVYDHPGR